MRNLDICLLIMPPHVNIKVVQKCVDRVGLMKKSTDALLGQSHKWTSVVFVINTSDVQLNNPSLI